MDTALLHHGSATMGIALDSLLISGKPEQQQSLGIFPSCSCPPALAPTAKDLVQQLEPWSRLSCSWTLPCTEAVSGIEIQAPCPAWELNAGQGPSERSFFPLHVHLRHPLPQ